MDPSMLVLLICRRFLFVHALPDITSVNISCTAGVRNVCGVIPIAEIFGFIGRGNIENFPMVRKLNNFWSKIILPVWVNVSGLLVRLPCAPLSVAVFNSYLVLFSVMFLTVLTSLSEFSSLSLVNIAFKIFSVNWMNDWNYQKWRC